MFGLDLSEIAVIAVVALIVIGPKDVPVALKALSLGIKKLRQIANDLQARADGIVQEAGLDDVSKAVGSLRRTSVKSLLAGDIDRPDRMPHGFTHKERPTVPGAADTLPLDEAVISKT